MPAICVSPAFPLAFLGSGLILTPEQRVSNLGAVWDASRGVVLSGSNFVTWADQVAGGTADTFTANAGNEPTYDTSEAMPCVNFAGAQRFDAAGSADIRTTAAWSICAWLKLTTGGTATVIYGDDTTPQRFSFRTNVLNQPFTETNGGSTSTYATALTVGVWYHVAWVFDGALAQALRGVWYIDGAAVTTANVSLPAALNVPTGTACFGAYSGGALPFPGKGDVICIGKTAWTASEVTALYNYRKRN